jgi:CysZ protein
MNTPLDGARYFFAGFKLISLPGMRRFVIIPLLINIAMFIALFFLTGHYLGMFNGWFQQHVPTWLLWLSYILWIVFFLSFFIVFVYTFVTCANLISAPFNSLLAEKIAYQLHSALPESRTLWENIRDIPRILSRQFSILGYYLLRALPILILFFIPIVHVFAALLWFGFNAWFITLTYIDYPTDNQRIPLPAVRAWLSQHRWVALGFGLAALGASMVPIVNFFTVPAAVAGATKLWVEENKS